MEYIHQILPFLNTAPFVALTCHSFADISTKATDAIYITPLPTILQSVYNSTLKLTGISTIVSNTITTVLPSKFHSVYTKLTNLSPSNLHPVCDSMSRNALLAYNDLSKLVTTNDPPTLASLIHISVTYVFILTVLYFAITTLYTLLTRLATPVENNDTYLIDIAVFTDFQPDTETYPEVFFPHTQKYFEITDENAAFTKKILERSGIDANIPNHLPKGILSVPPDLSMAAAREESALLMFNVVEQLLSRNNLRPCDIDVLVVNCSLFNPTPSHTSMIINHFKMRQDIISYNLGGMGCSASAIGVNCAKDALFSLSNGNNAHSKKDPLAIVVSFENLTQNFYKGNDKSMLVANALFRMGSSAVLLSRKPRSLSLQRPDARYKLKELVRTHIGADDIAYGCVFQDMDSKGKTGVALSKTVPKMATVALTKNMTALGPRVLSYITMIKYALDVVTYKFKTLILKQDKTSLTVPVPNFMSCIEYICIHAGGRGVIDSVQKALSMSDYQAYPSRETLRKYGNTSSSSIWYSFVTNEECRKIRRGEKVWQIAFGSGFKCNSMVWEKM